MIGDLTAGQVAVLNALWGLRSEGYTSAHHVQQRAAAMGHDRSLTTVRRALETLVQRDYAERHTLRYSNRPGRRVHYSPTRRPGEHVPASCVGSELRMWLWEARMDWRLWSLAIGERMVWIDNWGMRACAEDWTWLAARPALVLDGDTTPEDPAWWDDPPDVPPRELAQARRANLMRAFAARRALLASSLTVPGPAIPSPAGAVAWPPGVARAWFQRLCASTSLTDRHRPRPAPTTAPRSIPA